MITVHKTEIARQNNSQYFLRPPPPQNKLLFTNHVFRGAHVLLRGAPSLELGGIPVHTEYRCLFFLRYEFLKYRNTGVI